MLDQWARLISRLLVFVSIALRLILQVWHHFSLDPLGVFLWFAGNLLLARASFLGSPEVLWVPADRHHGILSAGRQLKRSFIFTARLESLPEHILVIPIQEARTRHDIAKPAIQAG